MLVLKDISKEYCIPGERVCALSNINLQFDKGEFVAIVGPSGCGKSTLLNIIAGLITPSEGNMFWNNINIAKMSAAGILEYRREHVGIVLQNFSLLNNRTVFQNVELPLKIRNINKKVRREETLKYIEQVGLLKKADVFPNQLSGGQKQRIAIARALITNPDMILADEPTGALDDENAQTVIKMLRNIADSGKIVLMVTHNLELVKNCDKVIKLRNGCVNDK